MLFGKILCIREQTAVCAPLCIREQTAVCAPQPSVKNAEFLK